MNIAEFIRDSVLTPRLKQAGSLVVYDADNRYHKLCLELANDKVRVIDATSSSIESREAALKALLEVGQTQAPLEGVLIFVPTKRPEMDEQKQRDPFAVFTAAGDVFPRDDGDDYLSLCLRAKPDHATKIRQLFSTSPNGPSFTVIDAIVGGSNWPQLRAILQVDSAREILTALMNPSTTQLEAMKAEDGWMTEARDFLRITLGLTLKTRGKTWAALSDELWRFLLFSEFVFDLPVALPDALQGVPIAPNEARPIVEDVCERLRSDTKSRSVYIDRAEAIESDFRLIELCHHIEDLGQRDTFPFEERTFLRSAIKGVVEGDTDATRRILTSRTHSVWMEKGESQAQWALVRSGLALIEACDDFERQLTDRARSQIDLIDFYLGSLREADRLQREFEQTAGEFLDPHGLMNDLIIQSRAHYRRLSEKVQSIFMKHVDTAGWPPAGRLANADIFDLMVADRLKENGRKVAYLMVDALRYELGVALEKLLSEDGPVELQASFAQLPTITPVGMASLLPGARNGLTLSIDNGSLVPKLDGNTVSNVSLRMGVFTKRYGDRFLEMTLNEFVRGTPTVVETVDLLVLRSTEIDSQLENNPESTLGLIPNTLKQIRVALHKLRVMGFKEAVIVTDHGFFLNAHAEAGDVCIKPQGTWEINAHDRMLLGAGSTDGHSLVVGSEKVGIRGDFSQVAMPRSMAPYRAGHLYFHGGASLQEAVVPVLVARLDSATLTDHKKIAVKLTYKNMATRITTRLPVIDVILHTDDLFSNSEILLEAQDEKGNVVGEPRTGGDVNHATRTVVLMPGQPKQIALRMDDEFRGKFYVRALDPTTLATYSQLTLETDYTE